MKQKSQTEIVWLFSVTEFGGWIDELKLNSFMFLFFSPAISNPLF
jgi:hypothetical protein